MVLTINPDLIMELTIVRVVMLLLPFSKKVTKDVLLEQKMVFIRLGQKFCMRSLDQELY